MLIGMMGWVGIVFLTSHTKKNTFFGNQTKTLRQVGMLFLLIAYMNLRASALICKI